jgi:hypothetical protein
VLGPFIADATANEEGLAPWSAAVTSQATWIDGITPGRVTTARDDPNRIKKRSRIGPDPVDASRVAVIDQG